MKINKETILKLNPLFQAIAEGKTIQINEGAVWMDIDLDGEGISASALIACPECYRIKPESKYRSFKDRKECWAEMKKHHPFGWVKSTLFKDFDLVQRVTTLYVEINREIIDYKDALDKFTFADGTNFGVKM